MLAKNPHARAGATQTRARTDALLRGLLFTSSGDPMYATYTRKNEHKYRYYMSKSESRFGALGKTSERIPAAEVEAAAVAQIKTVLSSPESIAAVCRQVQNIDSPVDEATTVMAMVLSKRGAQQLAATDTPAFDVTLLEGLGRAFYWQNLIDSGMEKSGSAIARQEGLHHSCVNELMRLTLLAPDLVDLLMAGRQPRRLSKMWFQRNRLPVDWQAQRDTIASFH